MFHKRHKYRWRAAYCLLGAISLNWTPAAATIFNTSTTGRKQMIANVYWLCLVAGKKSGRFSELGANEERAEARSLDVIWTTLVEMMKPWSHLLGDEKRCKSRGFPFSAARESWTPHLGETFPFCRNSQTSFPFGGWSPTQGWRLQHNKNLNISPVDNLIC